MEGTTLEGEQERDLTEVAAPRPVQEDVSGVSGTPEKTSDTTLEGEEENDLTEIAAPPPVQEDASGEWRKEEHLESQGQSPDDIDAQSAAHSECSEPVTLLYTISYLIFFSILGVLARLGVQWLTFYPGAPIVFDNLWANVGGTIVMGFLSEDRKLFQQEWGKEDKGRGSSDDNSTSSEDALKAHVKVKKTIPLFIGLATGFCGSFTSFSTFMRDVFFALSNTLPTPIQHPLPSGLVAPSSDSTLHRNGGYSVMAIIAVIIVTITMSLGSLVLGAHIAAASHKYTPVLPFRFMRTYVDPAFVVLGFGCWLGTIFLAIWPPDRPSGPASRGSWGNEVWRGEVLFALVFAPLGCLGRWYTSLKLNGKIPSFPLGTFAVNMFGCAIEAMSYDLQHVPLRTANWQGVEWKAGGGLLGCEVLQGIQDGFCGALTTVSTWATELYSLQRRHAYLYGAASVAGGMALFVVIMGTVLWTIGWQSPVCVV